eukprot:scaffold21888_cov177-Skeletonema_marinoi.AAC.5
MLSLVGGLVLEWQWNLHLGDRLLHAYVYSTCRHNPWTLWGGRWQMCLDSRPQCWRLTFHPLAFLENPPLQPMRCLGD